MQTFLNAMTFSDKTMYPVASTNDQDLLNLTDIYMDAVLHPAIYHKRAIFEQEGWHYELAGQNEGSPAGSEDAAPADPKAPRLALNGVVYNEMKGALSDPDSVLYDELQAALFPRPRTVSSRAGHRVKSPTSPTRSSWMNMRAIIAWTTAT